MHTKKSLMEDLCRSGVNPSGVLLVHSSLKSVGACEGGGDTVLDAFIDYMRGGLLVFPTHTWDSINERKSVYDPHLEPSCVGALTNLFLKRPRVVRSLHPTHSLAAIGKNAEDFVSGEEKTFSPCPRNGCYGKLLDMDAQILFMGCELSKNTFLHGVEEWNNIPNRLADKPTALYIKTAEGVLPCPQKAHYNDMGIDISENYAKMEAAFIETGAAKYCKIGDAASVLCGAKAMADLVSFCLNKKTDLFGNGNELDKSLYADWGVLK